MADDYAGDTTTTGNIVLGGSVSGSLDFSLDQDWFAVPLVAGRNYEIDLAPVTTFSGGGLGEQLLTPSGTRIIGGVNTRTLSYTPTASGTYYIDVNASSGSLGGYVLTASPFDDYLGDFSTSGRLSTGSAASGVLEGSGDTDNFAIALTAGYAYQLTLSPAVNFSGGGLSEYLIKSDGTVVTGGVNTRTITVTPTSTGTYNLSISASSGSTGSYTLSAAPADDYTGDFSTTGRLPLNGSMTAALQTTADKDYFAVSLTAGTTYTFNAAAAASFSGTLSEALIRGDGVQVAGGTSVRTFNYTPTASGTYYLNASSTNSGVGSYTINLATVVPGPTTSVPVYRFFDSSTGTQFLTSSDSERATVIATRPDLVNEGTGLRAAANTDPNALPVYRFFDNVYGTHFFTSSSSERDTVQATRSDLKYEGVGFNEYASQQTNTTAVYRFFDSNRGTHFFTSSASERATILSTRADLVPEGVSFYSPT